MRVSENFIANMKRRRKANGWSQQRLADRLDELGYRITRDQLAQIEARGTRGENLSLDEALAIACALSTPLTAMMLPTGKEEDLIEPVPGSQVNSWRVFEWLRCLEPLDTDDHARWRESVLVFWTYSDMRDAQTAFDRARSRRLGLLFELANERTLKEYDRATAAIDLAEREAVAAGASLYDAQMETAGARHDAETAVARATTKAREMSEEWKDVDGAYREALQEFGEALVRMVKLDYDVEGLMGPLARADVERLGIEFNVPEAAPSGSKIGSKIGSNGGAKR